MTPVKLAAIIALVLACTAASVAQGASIPDRYVGRHTNASFDLVFSFAGGGLNYTDVKGAMSDCSRIRIHAFECPFLVTYKVEETSPRERCVQNVVLPRKGWRWPSRGTCPPDWRPPTAE